MDFLDWTRRNADLIGLTSTVLLLVVTFWYAKTTKTMAEAAKDSAEDNEKATKAVQDLARRAEESVRESARATKAAEEMVRLTGESVRDNAEATEAAKEMARLASESVKESARATVAAERAAESARDAAGIAAARVDVDFRVDFIGSKIGSDHVPTIRLRGIGDPVFVREVTVARAFRTRQGDEDFDSEHQASVEHLTLAPAIDESALPRRVHRGEFVVFTHDLLSEESDQPWDRFIVDIEYSFLRDSAETSVLQRACDGPGADY